MNMAEPIKWLQKTAPLDAVDVRAEQLTTLALQVFGNRDHAMRWLRRPRREFGGATPLDMLETAAAARQVETLLTQLAAERDS